MSLSSSDESGISLVEETLSVGVTNETLRVEAEGIGSGDDSFDEDLKDEGEDEQVFNDADALVRGGVAQGREERGDV